MRRIVSITRTIRKQAKSEFLERVSSTQPGEKLESRKVKLENGEEKILTLPEPVGVNGNRWWAASRSHCASQATSGLRSGTGARTQASNTERPPQSSKPQYI